MQVAFDATLQDLIDVILAARARSPAARRDARLIALTAVLVAGATLVRAAPDGWLTGLGYAALAAGIVLGVGAVRRAGDRHHRHRVRAACRARLKGQEWFRVAVGWKDVTSVEAAGEPVDIWVRGHDIIRVQARAFDSGLDRESFVGLVERYATVNSG
jgi:hypothetical protein